MAREKSSPSADTQGKKNFAGGLKSERFLALVAAAAQVEERSTAGASLAWAVGSHSVIQVDLRFRPLVEM